MSIQAMYYVFRESPSQMAARLVLLSLANHANDGWLSWPAVQTMANETRLHERNVQRALRELQKQCEIEPLGAYSRGGRRSTTYLLLRCRDWFDNVGAHTSKTPYGNHGQNVGLAYKNEPNRVENGLIPRRSATPPPAQRHPTPGAAPPLPRRSATPPPAQRHPSDTTSATPAPAQRHPTPGTAPPYPSLNHHRTFKTPPAQNAGEKPTPGAGAPDYSPAVPEQDKELHNRRKIEARDRREAIEARAGVGRAAVATVNVGAFHPERLVRCNFCFAGFAPGEFATHECDEMRQFELVNNSVKGAVSR